MTTDSAHGYGPYTRGCRCEVCKQAKADYMRTRRAAARALAQEFTVSSNGKRGSAGNAWGAGAYRCVVPGLRHGTRYAYEERGCRCVRCTAARTSSDARYRSAS